MLEGYPNFSPQKEPSIQKANAAHFGEKIDPIKQLVIDLADIIGKEIGGNEKLNPELDFELLVRNPAKTSDQVTHLRGIHKDDLLSILNKAKEWAAEKKPTVLPLQPREIEALQQIANAIEKKELVIKQGDQFISHEQSPVYNAILNHAASIEKADQLGKQKIIGRKGGRDSEIVLGDVKDKNLLGGMYDVLKGGAEHLRRGVFGKKKVFGKEEYQLDKEEYKFTENEVKTIRKNRGSFSTNYKKEEEDFTSKYQNLSTLLKEQYDLTVKKMGLSSKEDSLSEKEEGDLKSDLKLAAAGDPATAEKDQLDTAQQVKKAYEKIFHAEESEHDREANTKRQEINKLEKDLDNKFERIQEEVKEYELKHEDDPPKNKEV